MLVTSVRSASLQVEQHDVLSAAVPLDLGIINTLPQVRKTMNLNGDMEDLVESILTKGQKVAGFVLALKPQAAGKYLKEVNRLWGTNHSLRRLKKVHFSDKQSDYYLILVYGHRRFRACTQAAKRLASGEMSTSFDNTYRCDIHFNMQFEDAFSIQLLENLYVAPPKHEEVAAMWRFWRYLKGRDGALTVSSFARQIGRKPEAVREMLRFSGLPESVQIKIQPDAIGGKTSYSVMLQIARLYEARNLYEAPMTETETLRYVNFHIAKRTRATDLAAEVSAAIHDLAGGQDDLFGGNTQEIPTRVIRKVAAGNMVVGLSGFLRWLHVIHEMMRDGESFGGLSPYADHLELDNHGTTSPHGVASMALRFVSELKEAVPDVVEMINRDGRSSDRLHAALSDLGIEEAVFSALLREE